MISEQIDFMMQRTHIYPRRNSRLSALEDKQTQDFYRLARKINRAGLYQQGLMHDTRAANKKLREYEHRNWEAEREFRETHYDLSVKFEKWNEAFKSWNEFMPGVRKRAAVLNRRLDEMDAALGMFSTVLGLHEMTWSKLTGCEKRRARREYQRRERRVSNA